MDYARRQGCDPVNRASSGLRAGPSRADGNVTNTNDLSVLVYRGLEEPGLDAYAPSAKAEGRRITGSDETLVSSWTVLMERLRNRRSLYMMGEVQRGGAIDIAALSGLIGPWRICCRSFVSFWHWRYSKFGNTFANHKSVQRYCIFENGVFRASQHNHFHKCNTFFTKQ